MTHNLIQVAFFYLFSFGILPSFAFDPQVVHPGVVQIDSHVSFGAYSSEPSIGSGFIVDLKNGLIASNRHVAAPHQIRDLEVKLSNGTLLDAKVVYQDPLADFAVLKVNPEELAEISDVQELLLAEETPSLHTPIVIVGSSSGYGFSEHPGTLTNLFEQGGFYGLRSYGMSVSSQPGSSGSPVIDANTNKVVGIHYSGDDKAHCFAVPITYLAKTLPYIRAGKVPPRHWSGTVYNMIPASHAAKLKIVPDAAIKDYQKSHPEYRAELLVVYRINSQATKETPLKVGDIVWEVNRHFVGADQLLIEKELDKAQPNTTVEFKVWRNGKLITLSIPVTDAHSKESRWLLHYANMVFFEGDTESCHHTGQKPGSVMVSNVGPGSPFGLIRDPYNFTIQLTDWCGHEINCFEDLIEAVKAHKDEKNISLKYHLTAGAFTYDDMFTSNQGDEFFKFYQVATPYPDPIIMYRDHGEYEWNKFEPKTFTISQQS